MTLTSYGSVSGLSLFILMIISIFRVESYFAISESSRRRTALFYHQLFDRVSLAVKSGKYREIGEGLSPDDR